MSQRRILWTRPLTSAEFDARGGQVVCWLTALLTLALGGWKLGRLEMTETELFFGVLLWLAVGLLMVLIGLVLPLAIRSTRPVPAAVRAHQRTTP